MAKHIQASPMLVDQKLMRAHFSGHLSAGMRYRRQNIASPMASMP